MNALVVYDSQFGNTEQIARTIAGALGQTGQARAVRVDNADPGDLQGVDLLVVGSPTQGWKPTAAMQTFLDRIPSGALTGRSAGSFDTRYRGFFAGSAARGMAKSLGKQGYSLPLPAESFFVKGKEG